MIAVVSPSSTSTSGRASVGMKPCTKELYVSLISHDSAAIVENTSELLPEPETPNTVSCRFGISTPTSLRLFTRAVHADQIVAVGNLQHRRLRVRLQNMFPMLGGLDDAERVEQGSALIGPEAAQGRCHRDR